MEKIDHTDGNYRGKRNSTFIAGCTTDELLVKKEKIGSPELSSDDDDDDESGEINVVDTSDNEAEFSLKFRLERQSLSSTSPVSAQCSNLPHMSIIKSNSLDERVVDNNNNNVHAKLLLSMRYSFDTPLDLSNKNGSDRNDSIFNEDHNDHREKTHSNNISVDRISMNDNPDDVHPIANDLSKNDDRKVYLSHQVARRSVIKSSDRDKSFPDVEEHFRRSLGKHTFVTFSQPKVEDHFARALGNSWQSADDCLAGRTETPNHY